MQTFFAFHGKHYDLYYFNAVLKKGKPQVTFIHNSQPELMRQLPGFEIKKLFLQNLFCK